MNETTPPAESILAAAVDIPAPADREAFLDRACGADPALRARVGRLVADYLAAGAFLEPRPGDPTAPHPAPAEAAGTVIGPYKLLESIGEGGMGLVFVAEQAAPVRRRVALKVIKPGMDTRQVVARFEAERQALALMDHPNIAKVHDAGATPDGRPYFVMELVKGTPVTDYCDAHRLTVRQRLELFLQVCGAVQHAHQKGVIHRDIKPSNVLVAVHDVEPVVKVIDFGIAKAVGQQLTDKTLYTGFAQLVGTPLYMSPEQAGESSLDVDTRTDVYALGVLLYELLTGTTPIDPEAFRKAGLDEIRRVIREDEPARPSARLSTQAAAARTTVAGRRNADPRKLAGQLRGELDWVVMRCLEKDRDRRYESVGGLAADVRRFLADEPVAARPPSVGYRLRKFSRRNRAAIGAATAAAAFVLTIAGSIGWAARDRAARRAEFDRDAAQRQAEEDRRAARSRADAEEQAAGAMAEARPRLRDGNPYDPQLVWAARRAEALAAGGLIGRDTARRAGELAADLRMLERLEQAALEPAGTGGSGIVMAEADAAYGRAFREYGVDVEALPPGEAGGRLRGRAIAVHLAAALDSWARARRGAGGKDGRDLLAVAAAADPDPGRVAVRRAWARGAAAAELEVRAGGARDWPAATHLALAGAFRDRGATALAVDALRRGQQQHPADFWLNNELAYLLATGARPPRPAEAVGYARAAVAARPASGLARLILGICLQGNQQWEEAAAAFLAAARHDPRRDADCRSRAAQALVRAGKPGEAEGVLREAIRVKPGDARAHADLAHLLAQARRPEEAVRHYREAARLRPDDHSVRRSLAWVLERLGRGEEAAAARREVTALRPDDPSEHEALAKTLEAGGRWDEAAAARREVVRLRPADFRSHYSLGTTLVKVRDLGGAAAVFREALRLNPTYAPAQHSLGRVLADAGDLDGALACFRTALLLRPADARAYTNAGAVLSRLGRPAASEAYLRAAVRLSPREAINHYNLGVALAKQGRSAEAEAAYREAIRLQPDYPDAHRNLGLALVRLERWGEAVAVSRQAVRVHPGSPNAHNTLAWLLATCPDHTFRDPPQAVALARKAVELAPGTADFWNTLGAAHYRTGDLKAAAGALTKAMDLAKGGDAADWFLLAMVHWQGGDPGEARRWYDRAAAGVERHRPEDDLRRLWDEAAELLGLLAPPPRPAR